MTGATAADRTSPFRKPRLAAFPKAFFHQLLAGGPMSIEDFIRRAPGLGLEGVELYPGFLGATDDGTLTRLLRVADDVGVELPMMCSSPDFIDPRPGAWERAVDKMRELVDVMTVLAPRSSWRSVRVLSGQAWPGVPEDEGIRRAVEGIQAVLAYAAPKQISVVMENHYKDGLWEYPEFALTSRRFLAIVGQLGSPWFGINFDPSNAIVAGEDPLDLLDRVVGRVRSMGASDRSLRAGFSLEDLQAHRGRGIRKPSCTASSAKASTITRRYSPGWPRRASGDGSRSRTARREASAATWISRRPPAFSLSWSTGTGPRLRHKRRRFSRRLRETRLEGSAEAISIADTRAGAQHRVMPVCRHQPRSSGQHCLVQ